MNRVVTAFGWMSALAVVAAAKTVTVHGADPAAITAAIAQSGPGDTVQLPAGTYELREPLCPKSHACLKGAGKDATVLLFKGEAPAVVVSLSGTEAVELCDLTLDGGSNPNASQGVAASNARGLRLHHLTIRNLVKSSAFGPHGVLFSGTNPTREGGVTDSEISDCTLENIGTDAEFGCGIRMSWGSSRNRVLRNTIRNTGRGGIFADNGSTDLVIQSNMVTGSGGEGIGIEVWGGCDRAVIEDNRIDHWLSIGGCDFAAVRRNVVADDSATYKFCGIEGIGSYLVITDNTVDGGQKIGLSVSGSQPKNYVLWARNTVRGCNQWGAQFQGEQGGIAYHYLYQCQFLDQPVGVGPVWYPGDEGHGFRTNGNVHHLVFEDCTFARNGRIGIQLLGTDVDSLLFTHCAIQNNAGPAVTGPSKNSALEWLDCSVSGNGSNDLPPSKPLPNSANCPNLLIIYPGEPRVNTPMSFDVLLVRPSFTTPTSRIPHTRLWDFGDGPPSTDAKPTHTYAKPGAYRVTLIAWDEAGRAARAEQLLTVAP